MAKTEHIKETSSFELPLQEKENLGAPIEDLKNKDYSALTTALFQKGEFRLLHGDKGGLAYFDMAAKLDPSNSELFLKQGLSLFEFGSHDGNEEGLTLASKRFKRATTLNPTCFEAWHLWGNTLFFLGNRKKEPSYFANALKKYEKAISLSDGQPSDVLADLFWDFGDIWGKLAHKSQKRSPTFTTRSKLTKEQRLTKKTFLLNSGLALEMSPCLWGQKQMTIVSM